MKKETKQKKETDVEKSGLKGNVKQIKETCYKPTPEGQLIHEKIFGNYYIDKNNFILSFDENGNKTEEVFFDKEGHSEKFLFDERGNNIVKWTSYNFPGAKEDYNPTHYSFNEKNQLIEAHYTFSETAWRRHTFKYDERGNQTEILCEGEDIENNNLHQEIYDEKNNRIEGKYYVAGKMKSWSKFDYDAKGNIIKAYKLNEKGNVETTHEHKPITDANGYPKKYEVPKNKQAKNYTYTYENDKHGNWIKKTEFYDKLVNLITIRDIIYYGEDFNILPLVFERPVYIDKSITANHQAKSTDLTVSEAQWLSEGGTINEPFQVLRYYLIKNNEVPSQKVYGKQDIEAIALMKELVANMDARVLFSLKMEGRDDEHRLIRYVLGFPHNGYLLSATQIAVQDADEYEVPEFITEDSDESYYVNMSQMTLFRPSEASGRRDDRFEESLYEYIDKCTLKKPDIPEKPEIYMIEVDNAGFRLQPHSVDDDFEIKNLDIHYGYGFEKFHTELMSRFKNETKGLILFHGEPGTGKTYYIRHLLRKMPASNKIVIYMPPNLVDHLVEPSFMTFLSHEISEHSSDGNFCVLLIEDAEPLLAQRQSESRIQGITNLLNMTDGLLNDMLNLQIVCTFNVHLKKLDKALLRPGRLIARKEFKAMNALDANRLAKQLGINHHFTAPATLSEVYALLKNKSTLIHDVQEEED